MTYVKQRKGWRMSCDVGEATEGLENELWRRLSDGRVGESCDVGEVTERLENELCSCMSLTGPLISPPCFTSWAARQVT